MPTSRNMHSKLTQKFRAPPFHDSSRYPSRSTQGLVPEPPRNAAQAWRNGDPWLEKHGKRQHKIQHFRSMQPKASEIPPGKNCVKPFHHAEWPNVDKVPHSPRPRPAVLSLSRQPVAPLHLLQAVPRSLMS